MSLIVNLPSLVFRIAVVFFVLKIFFSRVVSLYNLAYQQYSKKSQKAGSSVWPHLWVMCDGEDRQHTAYISASFHSVKQCGQYVAAGYVIKTQGMVCLILYFIVVWYSAYNRSKDIKMFAIFCAVWHCKICEHSTDLSDINYCTHCGK